MRRFLPFLPFLALGPVSGPLAALLVADLRRGRALRAALWGALLAAFWGAYPALAAYAIHELHR
jgi:hypothetical protein